MVKLFRCKICGDPYIGEKAPSRCPFCGAYEENIVEIEKFDATFDVELTDKDRKFVEKALDVEIGNAEFYACASETVSEIEGKQLFKCLKKVEAEHASIWKKILKLKKVDIGKLDKCSSEYKDNLQESHNREEKAIEFYKQSAAECDSDRVRELFKAIIQVEEDHLGLSGVRLK